MLIATPAISRRRLAAVSTQSTTSPVRAVLLRGEALDVPAICDNDGSSLSSAFSATASHAATYTASTITNGSAPRTMPTPRWA